MKTTKITITGKPTVIEKAQVIAMATALYEISKSIVPKAKVPTKIALVMIMNQDQKVKIWVIPSGIHNCKWKDVPALMHSPAIHPYGYSGLWDWYFNTAFIYYPIGSWVELCAEEIAHSPDPNYNTIGIHYLLDGSPEHAAIKARLMETANSVK